jgi:hypothetical protein
VAWYSWTQLYVPQFFPGWAYRVPETTIGISLILIGVLVAVALRRRPVLFKPSVSRLLPARWMLFTCAFVLGLLWFALVLLAYGAFPSLPPASAMLAGIAIAGLALGLIARWSLCLEWRDSSRLAVIAGALLASMSAGFLVLRMGGASAVDLLGKLVLNLLACVFLVRLARRIRSEPEPPASGID